MSLTTPTANLPTPMSSLVTWSDNRVPGTVKLRPRSYPGQTPTSVTKSDNRFPGTVLSSSGPGHIQVTNMV